MEFGQYVTASAFGIALAVRADAVAVWQHGLPLANIIAIVAASVSNFLANDRWTFKRHQE